MVAHTSRYAYSIHPNPWEWLTTRGKAEAMAEQVRRRGRPQVAGWRAQYGIEGVDLDLEEGAGSRPEAGPNMVHFIRKLKVLQPGFLVTQPTYGYPQAGPVMVPPSSDRRGDRCDQC